MQHMHKKSNFKEKGSENLRRTAWLQHHPPPPLKKEEEKNPVEFNKNAESRTQNHGNGH